MIKSKILVVRLTPKTHADLSKAAKADDRPVSAMARRLICQGLLRQAQEVHGNDRART